MHGSNENIHAFVDRKQEGEISRGREWGILEWGTLIKAIFKRENVCCGLGSCGSE
jgi:hypothetical protein